MNDIPSHARVVIIGAGIVGNSVAYHLAQLSWKNIVLIDKGPLPNPGGSTGHASNFLFPIEYSKVMAQITRDSMRQYAELGVFRVSGGMELARSKENLEELKRRATTARSWGIESELLAPHEVKRMLPFVATELILGGFYMPGIGVVDSVRAGTLMRL